MISTKGRYALRALADLASVSEDRWMPLKEIAQRQEISIKYLESILPIFTKAGIVKAVHGKGGGYQLVKTASAYTILEILELTESTLAPVACLQCDNTPCKRSSGCVTLPMWTHFNQVIRQYFQSMTLEDVIEGRFPTVL